MVKKVEESANNRRKEMEDIFKKPQKNSLHKQISMATSQIKLSGLREGQIKTTL